MENASKALLMAAGVLIGILILSLAVYLFMSFGATSAELHSTIEENQTNQFNSQFTSYVGKEGLTIYDVITVANLATENNKYYEFNKRNAVATGNDRYITVILKNDDKQNENIEYGFDTSAKDITEGYNNIIVNDLKHMVYSNEQNESDLCQYNCKVDISQNTKRVYKIIFEKK